MNENEPMNNETFDKALQLVERSDELTEQEIARLVDDEAVVEEARELWTAKKALERKHAAVPDAEGEWERIPLSDATEMGDGNLSGNHDETRCETRKSGNYALLSSRLLKVVAVAAALLLLFVLVWKNNKGEEPAVDGQLVYEASNAPRDIVISTSDGEQVVLGKKSVPGIEMKEGADKETMIVCQQLDDKIVESLTTSIPQGKMLKVVLSDGSEVWVNAGSRLVYPTRFVGDQRFVELEGEAYFKIAHDAAHPFIVKSPSSYTRVLGTEFNIRSFQNQPAQITLVRGSVEVRCTERPLEGEAGAEMRDVVLKPGQQLSIADHQLSVKEVDTDIYTYWKDGYFFYDDESLETIMRQIGSWYNVSVVFRNPKPRDYKIHFFCNRSSGIEQVIEQLNMLHKGFFSLKDRTIYVN